MLITVFCNTLISNFSLQYADFKRKTDTTVFYARLYLQGNSSACLPIRIFSQGYYLQVQAKIPV